MMSLYYITVYILLLISSFCIVQIYGKPMSNKESENEVIVYRKSTNNYGTKKKIQDDILVKTGMDYLATNKLHKHSKVFPAFEVIKCIVEEMSKRKSGQLASLEKDNLRDNICKLRYRRHHHTVEHIEGVTTKGSHAINQGSNNTHLDSIKKYDLRTIPQKEDNCTSITGFLANSSNLNFVRQKAKDLACIDADMSSLFDRFDKLANDDLIGKGHRAKIVRKWKHLGCRLYRRFLECTQKALKPANEKSNQTNIVGSSDKVTPDKEAVHVSDSSHIDFLNFMIGYNLEDNNDYQMWFY